MAITSNNMASLKCGHMFHLTCVNRRLSAVPNCPTCNKKTNIADVTQLSALPSKKKVPKKVAASPKASKAKPVAPPKKVEKLQEKLAKQAETIAKLKQEKAKVEKKVAATTKKNLALERRVEAVAKKRKMAVDLGVCRALTNAGKQCPFKALAGGFCGIHGGVAADGGRPKTKQTARKGTAPAAVAGPSSAKKEEPNFYYDYLKKMATAPTVSQTSGLGMGGSSQGQNRGGYFGTNPFY
jgi:hypothetical protein